MKKRKSNNKVLVVAIVLALVIVIGSTFAWFSSKDEVTNKLSASNNYNVLITETYTPEEDWVPGETVKKEVSAVNTGNTDAYVRLGFIDAINVKVASDAGLEIANLDATAIALGKLSMTDANYGKDETAIDAARALQAGGYIVYKVDKFVDDGTNAINAGGDPYTADGLYIFRREVQEVQGTNNYAYAGYYVKDGKYYALQMTTSANTDDLTVAGLTVVYKDDGNGGVTVNANSSNAADVKISCVEEKANNQFTFTYSLVSDYDTATEAVKTSLDEATAIKVVASRDGNSLADDVVVYLVLDEEAKNNFLYIADVAALQGNKNRTDDNKGIGWFVYNKLLAGGATTSNLITDVVLSKNTSNTAYISMDYDVNVVLDSVQAVFNGTDTTKQYTNASVDGWGVTVNATTGALSAQ